MCIYNFAGSESNISCEEPPHLYLLQPKQKVTPTFRRLKEWPSTARQRTNDQTVKSSTKNIEKNPNTKHNITLNSLKKQTPKIKAKKLLSAHKTPPKRHARRGPSSLLCGAGNGIPRHHDVLWRRNGATWCLVAEEQNGRKNRKDQGFSRCF